jgi:hypothetical protein
MSSIPYERLQAILEEVCKHMVDEALNDMHPSRLDFDFDGPEPKAEDYVEAIVDHVVELLKDTAKVRDALLRRVNARIG